MLRERCADFTGWCCCNGSTFNKHAAARDTSNPVAVHLLSEIGVDILRPLDFLGPEDTEESRDAAWLFQDSRSIFFRAPATPAMTIIINMVRGGTTIRASETNAIRPLATHTNTSTGHCAVPLTLLVPVLALLVQPDPNLIEVELSNATRPGSSSQSLTRRRAIPWRV